MDKSPNKNELEEYKDASSNLRHYSTLRFAQLTLFIATTGALLSLLFKPVTEVGYGPRKGIKLVGLAVVAAFWFFEKRSTSYWIHFKERAKLLEKILSFKQYSARPVPHKLVFELNATNAVRVLFISVAVFWIVSLVKAW